MARKIQVSSTYDSMFAVGGAGGVFDLPYQRSPYFPLFKLVRRELLGFKPARVLEVGCGTGAFAHFLLDTTDIKYLGFDFSPVAVRKAEGRTGKGGLFFCGDATVAESYKQPFDAIVCTEVLEHVPDDISLIGQWPSGVPCICSVPNFDSDYHERFFRTDEEVIERYRATIDIQRVLRVKKPVIDDLSWAHRLTELRWNRYRPRRLRDILGLGNFDRVGGWFVLVGTRK